MLKKSAFLLICVGLMGCDHYVKITDGILPDQFLAYAPTIVGDYPGMAEDSSGVLSLHLDGKKLILSTTVDLTGMSACQSQIGDLTGVSYNKKDDNVEIRSGYFAFNPGLCRAIQGRSVEVVIRKRADKIKLYSLIYDYTSWVMSPFPCSSPYEGGYCQRREERQWFLTGEFSKL